MNDRPVGDKYPKQRLPRHILLIICLGLLCGSTSVSAGEELPDLTGRWSGVDWGEVVLERIGPLSYVGTYSDTYGKDTGRIIFSFVSGRYEGKWWEGGYRIGVISLQLSRDGRTLSGTWGACGSSIIKPGEPREASFILTRSNALLAP